MIPCLRACMIAPRSKRKLAMVTGPSRSCSLSFAVFSCASNAWDSSAVVGAPPPPLLEPTRPFASRPPLKLRIQSLSGRMKGCTCGIQGRAGCCVRGPDCEIHGRAGCCMRGPDCEMDLGKPPGKAADVPCPDHSASRLRPIIIIRTLGNMKK